VYTYVLNVVSPTSIAIGINVSSIFDIFAELMFPLSELAANIHAAKRLYQHCG